MGSYSVFWLLHKTAGAQVLYVKAESAAGARREAERLLPAGAIITQIHRDPEVNHVK